MPNPMPRPWNKRQYPWDRDWDIYREWWTRGPSIPELCKKYSLCRQTVEHALSRMIRHHRKQHIYCGFEAYRKQFNDPTHFWQGAGI